MVQNIDSGLVIALGQEGEFVDSQKRIPIAFQFQLALHDIFQIFLVKIVFGHDVRILRVEFHAVVFSDQGLFLSAVRHGEEEIDAVFGDIAFPEFYKFDQPYFSSWFPE